MASWLLALAAVIGSIASIIGVFRIQQVHLSLNSRLDEWKKETDSRIKSAHAQGRQDERDFRKEKR